MDKKTEKIRHQSTVVTGIDRLIFDIKAIIKELSCRWKDTYWHDELGIVIPKKGIAEQVKAMFDEMKVPVVIINPFVLEFDVQNRWYIQ